MISIGNDIVDLSAIDKQRTRQKAFYSKILSDTEQLLYSRSFSLKKLPFEIFVWLLWSAKESVYKFAKRLDPELVFSPVRIEVSSESAFEPEFSEFKNFQNLVLERIEFISTPESQEYLNSVNFGPDRISAYNYQIFYRSDTYYLRSLISESFIATIATASSDFLKINWGIQYIVQTDYETQSAAVRNFTLKNITELSPGEADFSVGKSPVGYPIILKGQNDTDFKVSFAHHGHYVSYALGN